MAFRISSIIRVLFAVETPSHTGNERRSDFSTVGDGRRQNVPAEVSTSIRKHSARQRNIVVATIERIFKCNIEKKSVYVCGGGRGEGGGGRRGMEHYELRWWGNSDASECSQTPIFITTVK